jgi:predicted amidohydrolase
METKIAAVNMAVSRNKQDNLKHILSVIDEAAHQGVNILVLPEACLQGYADFAFTLGSADEIAQRRQFMAEAEPLAGHSLQQVQEACQRAKLYVQLGFIESGTTNAILYNSAAVMGPSGVMSVYRKCHNGFEFPYFAPGQGNTVTRLDQLTAGSLICYDLAFPEVMRTHALLGAELSLMSTAWPVQGPLRDGDYCGTRMDLAARANAFFNQMWLVVSDHCETGAYSTNTTYYGGAQIVDPTGEVVTSLGTEEGMITVQADISAEVAKARTESFYGLSLLQDRRPELYGALTARTPVDLPDVTE